MSAASHVVSPMSLPTLPSLPSANKTSTVSAKHESVWRGRIVTALAVVGLIGSVLWASEAVASFCLSGVEEPLLPYILDGIGALIVTIASIVALILRVRDPSV